MKKLLSFVVVIALLLCLVGCGDDSKVITVGATPSPHAEILNSDAVQNYVKSQGYELKVVVYQDYVTPNKALNDKGIDANYFQHIPYLNEEIANKGYELSVACEVHNEPLNLYGKSEPANGWDGVTINIIDDASNVERAYKLLVAEGLIDSYVIEGFDAGNPVYTSSKNVKIECINSGLLAKKVDEGGYAVIPGNYALTAWGATTAASYKLKGETTEVAYPNIIACRTADLQSEKIKVLVDALGQDTVKTFIQEKYGPTVNYCFKSNLK